jgi:hypothetical protein
MGNQRVINNPTTFLEIVLFVTILRGYREGEKGSKHQSERLLVATGAKARAAFEPAGAERRRHMKP